MFKGFDNIALPETILVNVLRTFSAGIVWTLFSLFMPNDTEMPFYTKLIIPFVVPVIWLTFLLIRLILSMFNLGGVGNILCMIVAIPGDPLVFLLHGSKPEWVPVEEYKFLNFSAVITVYKGNIPNRKVSKNNIITKELCPFEGEVIADSEILMLGLTIPVQSTVFTISSDWSVNSKGLPFGYIDEAGQIRKGVKGKPNETLASGSIIGQVKSGNLWIKGKKVGSLI